MPAVNARNNFLFFFSMSKQTILTAMGGMPHTEIFGCGMPARMSVSYAN